MNKKKRLHNLGKNAVQKYQHMPTDEKDCLCTNFEEQKELLQKHWTGKNSHEDKLKQEFPKSEIPTHEDDKNEFKASFKADTIHHETSR